MQYKGRLFNTMLICESLQAMWYSDMVLIHKLPLRTPAMNILISYHITYNHIQKTKFSPD
jgi:hypothetical protein